MELRDDLEALMEDKKSYDMLTFEEIGFDMVVVDEAHEYKNLSVAGKLGNIKGMQVSDAAKTSDMLMKLEYVKNLHNNKRGVIFGTGTPISNSMAELFIMTKYLRPDLLEEREIGHFDAWARTFADIGVSIEVAPKGGFKVTERFKQFKNIPELIQIFREYADIKLSDDLELPVPELEGGKPIIVKCKPHKALGKIMDDVDDGWEQAIRDKTVLTLFNIVRVAPIDVRLVDGSLKEHKESKVNQTVKNVKKDYDETKKQKGTQIIFLNRGRSNITGFDLYKDLINKLVRSGIPKDEIALVQGGISPNKLNDIYAKTNKGEIRILIGSQSKLGTGVNVQERLFATHEIDVPYRPSDIEQGEGRMLRQGNKYYDEFKKPVKIYRYVTQGDDEAFSGDAYSWQIIEQKRRNINKIMKGDPNLRILESDDEDTTDASLMKAIATGNPLFLEKIKVEKNVEDIQIEKNSFLEDQLTAKYNIKNADEKIHIFNEKIRSYEQYAKPVLEMLENKTSDDFNIDISGKFYTDKKAALKAIKKAIEMQRKLQSGEDVVIGTYKNFNIIARMDETVFERYREESYYIKVKKSRFSSEAKYSLSDKFAELDDQIASIDNTIRKLPKEFESYKENLEFYQKKKFDSEKLLEEEFEKEDQFQEAKERLEEIDKELGIGELDMEEDAAKEEIETKSTNRKRAFAESTAENIRPNNTRTEKAKPIKETLKSLSKHFNIPMTTKRFAMNKNKVSAYYTEHSENIVSRHRNDVNPISHELGHHLDKQYGLASSNKALVKQMIENLPDAFKEQYKKHELPGEAIAEFVRRYLINPGVAKEFGGAFFNLFETAINQKDLKALKQAQKDLKEWYNQDPASKIESTMVGHHEKVMPTKETFKRVLEMKLFDNVAPLKHFMEQAEKISGKKAIGSKNAYKLALNAKGSDMMAAFTTTEKMVDPKGNIVGESFANVLKDIDRKKEFLPFNGYIKAVHSLDYMAQGKRVYTDDITESDITAAIEHYEREYPHFKATAENLYTWWDKFIDTWLVDTGLLDQGAREVMKEMYPHYVPNFRASSLNEAEMPIFFGYKGGYANQKTPIKRSSKEGGTEYTYYPIESFVTQIDKVINTVKRREVLLAITDIVKNVEGMGNFLHEVPMKYQATNMYMIPTKYKVFIKLLDERVKLLSKTEQLHYSRLSYKDKIDFAKQQGWDDIPEIIDSIIDDFMVQFSPQKINFDKEMVTVMNRAGETEHYEVTDPLFLRALLNLSPKELGPWMSAFAQFTRLNKTLITSMNPFFTFVSNAPRDFFQAGVMSDKRVDKYITGYAKSVVNILKKSAEWQQYKAMGGGHSSRISADRNMLNETLEKIMPTKFKDKKMYQKLFHAINKAIEKIEWASDAVESAPRLAEFLNSDISTYDGRVEGLYNANDITLNFKKRGEWSYHIDPVIMFFNAGMQELEKMYRTTFKEKDKRKGRLLKALMLLTLPTMILYFFNKDDEDYKQLSPYNKYNYWCIPTDGSEFFKVPKPRGLGDLFSSLEEELAKSFEGDEKAFKDFSGQIVRNWLPPHRPIFAPEWDVATNRHWVGGGRRIVSQSMENRPDYLEYDKGTSSISKAIGKATNISPKKINYLLDQHTGIIGDIALPATAEGESVKEVFKRKLFTDSLYSNDILNEFYDNKGLLDDANNGYKFDGVKNEHYDEYFRKYYSRTATVLSKYRKQIKRMEDSKASEKIKEKQTREIQQKILDEAKELNEKYKNFKKKNQS
ncbi:LPD38 domain-containing protein [Marinisporobacter balticus]|uniref:SNF2 domain-containing protein n=1 Tax=Marinisporobacter balticus TaxID=2018667 RepID=A0A4R2L561_9FIRM|nr:LPD38 domain-containing protein [Marinisporobacter balticus]TCO79139.1 SNF2 domain-containing protein [Marinisporobacter balticus]